MDLYNEIYELSNAVQERRNTAISEKNYEVQSVATVQADFMNCIYDLAHYTLMLNNRNTLEVEGFLIDKLEYSIARLKNAQARIKAAK
jgi:hypothetical protein